MAYKDVTCRGSYALGTACGHCERCKEEKDCMFQSTEPVLKQVLQPSLAWAIGKDYGCEGQQPPLALFRSLVEAEATKTLIEAHSGTGVYLVEVPYWPGIRTEEE